MRRHYRNLHLWTDRRGQTGPECERQQKPVAIQYIRLENEGWVREDLPEPVESGFEDPA
ncbi:hypothetical protein [Streptomyces kaniharaensis]|uniref:hypothetical protein n=1 Tax=Streptomyces kaniharaensis TaxID=212423 RepID=UPI0012960F09|nr:hypothetical protein [Streptomyces kaniharaensis]